MRVHRVVLALAKMASWLKRQWDDVKGNVKFYVLTLIATGVVTGGVVVTRSLQWWQQAILVACFVLLVAWGAIATWGWKSGSGGAHASAVKTGHFDPVQLADIRGQVESLSSYERLALKQLIVKDGMTGAHFYQFIVEQGFPIGSLLHQKEIEKVFDVIAQKTTLLERNYTTGHSLVKPGLVAIVRSVLNPDDRY